MRSQINVDCEPDVSIGWSGTVELNVDCHICRRRDRTVRVLAGWPEWPGSGWCLPGRRGGGDHAVPIEVIRWLPGTGGRVKDRLEAGGAYVNHGYLVADALGSPCHPETLSGWFEAAVAACGGLRRISLHGCRHTCATNMLKAGEPIHVVSRFLGHSNVQITLDVYGHVLPGQEEQVVIALVAEYA